MGTVDLNLLAIFAAVARTSSFSAAARELGIPKSSVSRAIAGLELALGVRLVHRTTRHVALSTAGVALHERVTPQLSALLQSLGDLPELEEQPSGKLRITATVDFAAVVLAEIVARFVVRHPGVEVELRLTNALVDLVAEGFDLAFRISLRRLRDSSLTSRRIGGIARQVFAAPSYLARRGTPRSPSDLASHEWVVLGGTGAIELNAAGESAVVEPRGRVMCDDMSFVHAATREGAGLGILPTFLAEFDVAAGALVRVLPRWTMRTGDLWVLSPASRHAPRKVTAFSDFVIAALKARPLALLDDARPAS
ncbi:MAG: LysR family transcriptional regulator [Byssovorax sp.]